MDITTRLLFGTWHWADPERRFGVFFCGLAALISSTTLASVIVLYDDRFATDKTFEQPIDFLPHRNDFSAGHQIAYGYGNCRTQVSATHGDCTDGCSQDSVQSPEAAGITWLVLECQQAESSLYSEFAQEAFHGMGGGLSIELIKPHWSF